MFQFLVIVLSFNGLASGQGSECPIDFVLHDNSCYHIFATPKMSWWDAMGYCAMYGGDSSLATIESEDEQFFLEAQLKAKFPTPIGEDFWLGANDLIHENTWVWVKRNEYVGEYTRWAPGQPSSGTSENCLALFDGVQYQWNDAPCHLDEGFICEIPANNVFVGK